jgi:hypothetical protein
MCYEDIGLGWIFDGSSSPTFLVNARLPFEASITPAIFQLISNRITRLHSYIILG